MTLQIRNEEPWHNFTAFIIAYHKLKFQVSKFKFYYKRLLHEKKKTYFLQGKLFPVN